MDKGLTIIELSPERWREYKALRLEALAADPQAFGQSYEKSVKDPDLIWEERLVLSQRRDGWLFLFAEHNKKLVGMSGARFDADNKEIAKIVAVYVKRNFRNRGIANNLLTKILEELSQIKKIQKARVIVNRLQSPAVNLYKKMKFKFTKTEKMNLGDGEKYDLDSYEQDIR